MSTVDVLLDRNRHFAAERFLGPMALMPRLRTTVIGCLDPRVDPAHVLGLELGDAPVIRNVGGRVTPAVLQALDLLALGFPAQLAAGRDGAKGDLVVLHHNECGITRMQGDPELLAASFGVHVSGPAPPRRSGSARLPGGRRRRPANHLGVADAYRVTGLFYDVTTGSVEQVVAHQAAA